MSGEDFRVGNQVWIVTPIPYTACANYKLGVIKRIGVSSRARITLEDGSQYTLRGELWGGGSEHHNPYLRLRKTSVDEAAEESFTRNKRFALRGKVEQLVKKATLEQLEAAFVALGGTFIVVHPEGQP